MAPLALLRYRGLLLAMTVAVVATGAVRVTTMVVTMTLWVTMTITRAKAYDDGDADNAGGQRQ